MNDLLSTLPSEWKTWGLLIVLGLPMLIVLAGELLLYLEKRDSAFTPIVQSIRNVVLPIFSINVILSKIIKLESDSILLKVSDTLFWLIFILVILKFVNIFVFSDALPKETQKRIPKLLIDFARTFLIMLGTAIIASNVWGADLGKLLAALGVGSIVLGLALQDVLGGLFSGVALLSSKPFLVGDWIKIGETSGKVINIDWRAVTLEDLNGDTITIPNATIANDMLINYSRPNKLHGEAVTVNISYDVPPNRVKQVLLEVIDETKGILKTPAPQVALIAYNTTSVAYEVCYYIDDYEEAEVIKDDFISKIWYANRRYGIAFPIDTMELEIYQSTFATNSSNTPNHIKEQLLKLEIFSVPDQQLLELAKRCQIDEFGVGECLLHKGVITGNVYVIIDGVASEHIENQNGEFLHEKRLKIGDMFGLEALVRKEPSLVTICALSDIKVITISIEAMKELLHKNPEVAHSLESMVNVHENKLKKSLFDR